MHADTPKRAGSEPSAPAHDYHTPRLSRRTAGREAAFFLPYLRPGMRVLDCGCGPGSITLGLADAVRPGEVVGIDSDAGRLEHAHVAAREHGVTNVRFEQGSLYALPPEDGAFDAALVHAVMEHLDNPVAALREVRRVLKPGGVVGVRTPEHCAALTSPADPLFERMFDLYRRQKQRIGQDAEIGRSLRAVVRAAGFSRVVGSASIEVHGTPEATRDFAEDAVRVLSGSPWAHDVLALGWVDLAELEQIKAAWRDWGDHPDAFRAVPWCEAVGWVQ